MVAPDDARGADLAVSHELVEREAGLRPLAVPEPADPGGQALERDLLLGHRQPAAEALVLWEELQDRPVRPGDVRRITAQRCPPARAATLAEQGPHEGRHEPGVVEGVRHSGRLSLGAEVVAV